MFQIFRMVFILFLMKVRLDHPGGITAVDGFLCKSLGSFPHVNDCRKFYGCYVAVGKNAWLYTCPSDSPIYNPVEQKCVTMTSKALGLCPSSLSPSQTSSSSWGLSPSEVILPSSTVGVLNSQYTPSLSKVVAALTSVANLAAKTTVNLLVVPTLTTLQGTSSPQTTTVHRTLNPPMNALNWTLCKSVPLEEKVTCFKNEVKKSKEWMHNGTSTIVIRNILRATATNAADALDALIISRKNNSAAFNAFEIIAVLEEIWKDALKHLRNSNETMRMSTKSFVFESALLSGGYKFPEYSQLDRYNATPTELVSDYIQLPQKMLSKDKYPCRSVSALYLNLHSLVPVRMRNTTQSLKLNSHVISMLLCVPVKKILEAYVIIVMKHLKVLEDKDFTYCVFWDFSISTVHGRGAWSRDGCHVVTEHSNKTHTMCACDHLTNFAVLMGSSDVSLSNANRFVLSLITHVGCGLSLFGAVGAIASFLLFTQLNTDRHIIHGNLLISIAISQTIFLAGIEQTQNKIQCKFTAIMLHYFYLASFGWMLCEGLHLYTMVVKVFNLSSKIYHYIALAWGVPALIVLITVASRYSEYGTNASCWISTERNTLLAFIIPVAGTIFANMVILALVLNEICRLQTSGRSSMGDIVRSTVKSLAVLFPLLGITWLFGLLVFATHNIVFQYLFALFNTMQGFFIFLLHCLFNSEIRKNFKRKKESWKSLKAYLYLRKRLLASTVVPLSPRSSLSEKASTFKLYNLMTQGNATAKPASTVEQRA